MEVKILVTPDVGGKPVEVVEVLVKSGDLIEVDDSIITVETEKASMDIPAPFQCVVREVFVSKGQMINEGDKLLTIEKLNQDSDNLNENTNENIQPIADDLESRIRMVEQKLTETQTHFLGNNTPAKFLGVLADSVKYNQCFIVMPYTQEWSLAVENIIKQSCENAGFTCVIAKQMDGRYIPHDIWSGITGSGIIIADLTGSNPNVAYELGLADAIGREVILLSQSSEVPFDFAGQRLIIYENNLGGASKLLQSLETRLRELRKGFKLT
jgi:hypothetical protein